MAARLVKYLLNNRKHATYWNSTRDTALCIEALADYLKASGEDKPDMTVEVWLDGKKQKDVEITPSNLFTFDNKFVLEGDAVDRRPAQGRVQQEGHGPAVLQRLPDQLHAGRSHHQGRAGDQGQPQVLQAGRRPTRRSRPPAHAARRWTRRWRNTTAIELANLAMLKSGDLVEIELDIDSKNDYEYLLFEDMKAAGFEPVEVRSGYNGNDMGAYMEFRDERVMLLRPRAWPAASTA